MTGGEADGPGRDEGAERAVSLVLGVDAQQDRQRRWRRERGGDALRQARRDQQIAVVGERADKLAAAKITGSRRFAWSC
jgi:hypothetical protein